MNWASGGGADHLEEGCLLRGWRISAVADMTPDFFRGIARALQNGIEKEVSVWRDFPEVRMLVGPEAPVHDFAFRVALGGEADAADQRRCADGRAGFSLCVERVNPGRAGGAINRDGCSGLRGCRPLEDDGLLVAPGGRRRLSGEGALSQTGGEHPGAAKALLFIAFFSQDERRGSEGD